MFVGEVTSFADEDTLVDPTPAEPLQHEVEVRHSSVGVRACIFAPANQLSSLFLTWLALFDNPTAYIGILRGLSTPSLLIYRLECGH